MMLCGTVPNTYACMMQDYINYITCMFCLVCVVCHLICRAKHHGWQDTYVFTKAMGEMVINSMRGEIPVVIIRPRVIESTLRDPFPGWIQGNRSVTYYYMLDICPCIVTGSRIFALRTTLMGIHVACGLDEHIKKIIFVVLVPELFSRPCG